MKPIPALYLPVLAQPDSPKGILGPSPLGEGRQLTVAAAGPSALEPVPTGPPTDRELSRWLPFGS